MSGWCLVTCDTLMTISWKLGVNSWDLLAAGSAFCT